jgi:hypothetical protein
LDQGLHRPPTECVAPSGLAFFCRETQGVVLGWHVSGPLAVSYDAGMFLR